MKEGIYPTGTEKRIRGYMNNFVSVSSTTYVKSTKSFNNTNYQSSFKKK